MNTNRNLNIPPIPTVPNGQPVQHRTSDGRNNRVTQSPTPHRQNTSWQPQQVGGAGGGGGWNTPDEPKKKKKSKGPWRIVFWIAILLLIASLIGLGVIGYSYWQGQRTYKDVADQAVSDFSGKSLADMEVDWDALRAMNPDVVGWVYVPDTVINYPIVQGPDDEKYLYVDFLGGKGEVTHFGTIFLSADNTADFSDRNNIIYGHNMNDGSMFAPFANFLNSDDFNAHRIIYLLTPEANYLLDTFTVLVCDAYDPLAQTSFKDDEEFLKYVEEKIGRNKVIPSPAGTAAKDIKRTYAFVTCTSSYEDTRVVLYANAIDSTTNGSSTNTGDALVINDKDVNTVEDAAKEIK